MARPSWPSPPTQMREMLEAHREAGTEFNEAWELAIAEVKWPYDTATRRQWKEALRVGKPEYRAAYHLEPPTRTGQIFSALNSALNHEGEIDPNEYELRAVA